MEKTKKKNTHTNEEMATIQKDAISMNEMISC